MADYTTPQAETNNVVVSDDGRATSLDTNGAVHSSRFTFEATEAVAAGKTIRLANLPIGSVRIEEIVIWSSGRNGLLVDIGNETFKTTSAADGNAVSVNKVANNLGDNINIAANGMPAANGALTTAINNARQVVRPNVQFTANTRIPIDATIAGGMNVGDKIEGFIRFVAT